MDLPSLKITSSLWSSSISSISDTTQEDNKLLDESDLCTVPRTGSFVNELDKRLEISKKKGEPVSQIIPHNDLTLRKSAPNLTLDVILPPPKIPMTPALKSRKSVPTSASSPSLVLPPSIKRSTTNSSVHSMSSNSSISTNQSTPSNHNKKNIWHFHNWFSHPPLPSSMTHIPTSMHVPQPSAEKRARVLHELVSTEKLYQTDMELIKEIFYDNAFEAFTKLEVKQIFVNLLEIIAFEKDFITLLEDTEITIDLAFSFMVSVHLMYMLGN